MSTFSNGLAKLEIGDPGAGGTMGTTLEEWGKIMIDSAALTEEEGTVNEFFSEQDDKPVFTRRVPGRTTLAFQLMDADLEAIQKVFGGTISGTAPDETLGIPSKKQEKEVSIKITPDVGNIIQIPRAKLSGIFNIALSKNALQLIDITADVLTPVGATPDDPIIFGPLVA